MKKNVALVLLASLLSVGMMAGCESTSNTLDNTDVSATMKNTESSESSKIQEDISSETKEDDNAIGGTADACTLHSWNTTWKKLHWPKKKLLLRAQSNNCLGV